MSEEKYVGLGYCQLEAKSPVFETKSSNSRTVNQQLKGFCGRSKRQRMAQVDNTHYLHVHRELLRNTGPEPICTLNTKGMPSPV